jgi:hypothetical protein
MDINPLRMNLDMSDGVLMERHMMALATIITMQHD